MPIVVVTVVVVIIVFVILVIVILVAIVVIIAIPSKTPTTFQHDNPLTHIKLDCSCGCNLKVAECRLLRRRNSANLPTKTPTTTPTQHFHSTHHISDAFNVNTKMALCKFWIMAKCVLGDMLMGWVN